MAEIDPLLVQSIWKEERVSCKHFMNSKCILDFENNIFKYVVVGYIEDYYYRSSNIQYLFVGVDMREQILRKLNIGLQNKVSFAY